MLIVGRALNSNLRDSKLSYIRAFSSRSNSAASSEGGAVRSSSSSLSAKGSSSLCSNSFPDFPTKETENPELHKNSDFKPRNRTQIQNSQGQLQAIEVEICVIRRKIRAGNSSEMMRLLPRKSLG
ncbi:hypothetical protein Droror1_Dr00024209 [Drosera rotundifolia]